MAIYNNSYDNNNTLSADSQDALNALVIDQPYKALSITKKNRTKVAFDEAKLKKNIERIVSDFAPVVSIDALIKEILKNIYDGVTSAELEKAIILAAVAFIEQDPAYNTVATRLLQQQAYKEVFSVSVTEHTFDALYRNSFTYAIQQGVQHQILHADMLTFDLEQLASALCLERDSLLSYLGMETLYERYFFKINNRKKELPQTFWMRIAMGLALHETHKNEKALEFYEAFSTLRYISSTPTLFHSGYVRAQLSSCFLTTIGDDLSQIFKCIGDNAQLAKWAGGIGNDWTNIRGNRF